MKKSIKYDPYPEGAYGIIEDGDNETINKTTWIKN